MALHSALSLCLVQDIPQKDIEVPQGAIPIRMPLCVLRDHDSFPQIPIYAALHLPVAVSAHRTHGLLPDRIQLRLLFGSISEEGEPL